MLSKFYGDVLCYIQLIVKKRGLSSILKDSYFKKGLQMFFQMLKTLETTVLVSTKTNHSILRYHNYF